MAPPLAASSAEYSSWSAAGIAGPGPSEATYAAIAATSSSENCAGLRGICAPVEVAAGIRPVDTWKSTAAAPTPTRDGPSELPSAFTPWQLEQLRRNSAWPSSMLWVETPDAASAWGEGASAV